MVVYRMEEPLTAKIAKRAAEAAKTNCAGLRALCGCSLRSLRLEAFSVALPNEFCNPGVGFRQRLLVWQEHDAEMLGARFLAES